MDNDPNRDLKPKKTVVNASLTSSSNDNGPEPPPDLRLQDYDVLNRISFNWTDMGASHSPGYLYNTDNAAPRRSLARLMNHGLIQVRTAHYSFWGRTSWKDGGGDTWEKPTRVEARLTVEGIEELERRLGI